MIHLILYKTLIFEKFLKFVFEAFYSDQAFWDFLDIFFVCKKRLVNKSFVFLDIEKDYGKIPIYEVD